MIRRTRTRLLSAPRALLVAALVAAPLVAVPNGALTAAPVVVASDLTGGAPLNLVSFTDDPLIPFTSPADGFNVFQRGVSPTIPFDLLDDSAVGFPGDSQGIIVEADLDPFFGIVDTDNGDTVGAPVTATWVFDISGASDLAISVDLGAMGDFESSDAYEFAYSIDAGPGVALWSLTADEASSRTYTMAGGLSYTYNDPLDLGALPLSNVLQTVTAPIAGTGSQLTLTVTADTNGGGEAVVFNNIVITSDDGSLAEPVPGDLLITEVMQNPAAVSDGNGEWFEIKNVSGADINIDGWTIRDDGSDSHVISGPLVVAAGDSVVLGRNANSAVNGGVTVDYAYGTSWFLSNSADEVILDDPSAVEFDRIEYDGGPVWPDPNGAAMNLDPPATDVASNNDGANWCEGISPYGDGDLGTPGADNDTCEPPEPDLEFIHDIQGSGPTVAISGPVKVEAIVTSLFDRADVLDGFFVLEEDADADSDAATSEGIFVFCRGNCPGAPDPAPAPGDLVTVIGSATEFFGMSQIDMSSGSATIGSSGNPLPTASAVDLPAAASTVAELTFENVEGMHVTFPDELVVSEYFQLARFGQLVLTESSRPFQFTHLNAPSVAGYSAFIDDLATRRIILDDDSNDNNDAISDGPDEAYYYPEGGLSLGNKFRGGDTITDLTGVMHWSFAGGSNTDAWRIRPIPLVHDYSFVSENPAPTSPDTVGGSLQVASFNVLNYFTTIDVTSSGSSGDCGPSFTLDCRGADSVAELDRQRDKIVAAMVELDADVLGLIEIQNDDDTSAADLVAGLNAATAAGTYDYIPTGFIGTDAIKVALIYKPGSVSPLGAFKVLDSSVDPLFIDTKNRPVLIQTFVETSSDERFTVAVNHLKSKGSPCDDVGDPGLNDGQANCPGTREDAATALADYLATDPTGSGDPDFLIIGDLNAYAMEDAITALTGVGYTDLIDQFQGSGAYSFVFDGQLGYLDHALANGPLLPQVTGVTEWHINADEVNVFDYNDDIRDIPGEASFERETTVGPLYAPDPLRSSDHDPLLVGLGLDSIPDNPTCNGLAATIVGTPGDDVIVGTNQSDVIVSFGGDDTISGGNGDDVICAGYGNDDVDGGNGKDLVFGEQGDDTVAGDNGKDSLDGGAGIDDADGGNGVDVCANFEAVLNCES
jgi:predicted extracellular nuclease